MEEVTFDLIRDEFVRRAHTAVWCSMATVDAQGRPRSRVIHPIWDSDGKTGYIGTFRDSYKGQHLAKNPNVSLAYIADLAKPLYVEAVANWADDEATKLHTWALFKDAQPPLGYDPASIFVSPDHPRFGVLKLTPWRIQVETNPPGLKQFWRK
ncbi:MAG: pyridoxamine 5'-phosphate oxidase family protein [Anaerolineae bacterium]